MYIHVHTRIYISLATRPSPWPENFARGLAQTKTHNRQKQARNTHQNNIRKHDFRRSRCVYTCIFIYIYIYRERERVRVNKLTTSQSNIMENSADVHLLRLRI